MKIVYEIAGKGLLHRNVKQKGSYKLVNNALCIGTACSLLCFRLGSSVNSNSFDCKTFEN